MYQAMVRVSHEVSEDIPTTYNPVAVVNQVELLSKIETIITSGLLISTTQQADEQPQIGLSCKHLSTQNYCKLPTF